jgi:hypothetical protein
MQEVSYDQAVAIVRGVGYAIVMPANVAQAAQGYSHIVAFRMGNMRVGPGFCLNSEATDALFAMGTIHDTNSQRTIVCM